MSLLKTLFTTVAALVFIAVAGFVAYVAYSIFVDIKTQTEKKLQKKNVIFTKDGMKVGVKEVTTEKTIDSTQKVLVDAWKLAQNDKKSAPDSPTGETSRRFKSEERPKPLSRTHSTPVSASRTASHSSR